MTAFAQMMIACTQMIAFWGDAESVALCVANVAVVEDMQVGHAASVDS